MSKKDKTKAAAPQEAGAAQEAQEQEQVQEQPDQAQEDLARELEKARAEAAEMKDKFLRLAAEYENYRRRTAKEKQDIWAGAKGDVSVEFLPVYDNLERALKQETTDEAYKKGVEMTMNQLRTVLEKLGITPIEALGQSFDPNLHNAVMHVDDDSLGENIVAEVFQTGFQLGEKVIRYAMVKVAN